MYISSYVHNEVMLPFGTPEKQVLIDQIGDGSESTCVCDAIECEQPAAIQLASSSFQTYICSYDGLRTYLS